MTRISIIDYGIGNLLSVKRAFEYIGAEVQCIDRPEEVLKATHIVLPGVGAFKDGMRELKQRGFVEAIQTYCDENRPFLGICLGMQMMLEESEEFGVSKGLGIIKGKVVRIPDITISDEYQKVPHVGWNHIVQPDESVMWDKTILDGICNRENMYFVHSYTARPTMEQNRLADAYYGGQRLSAVIRRGNCYGTQFHPEKSGKWGLKIIYNFIQL